MTNTSVNNSSQNIIVPANSKKKIEWKVKIDDVNNELDSNNSLTDIDIKINS
jgi:hypothetical protein